MGAASTGCRGVARTAVGSDGLSCVRGAVGYRRRSPERGDVPGGVTDGGRLTLGDPGPILCRLHGGPPRGPGDTGATAHEPLRSPRSRAVEVRGGARTCHCIEQVSGGDGDRGRGGPRGVCLRGLWRGGARADRDVGAAGPPDAGRLWRAARPPGAVPGVWRPRAGPAEQRAAGQDPRRREHLLRHHPDRAWGRPRRGRPPTRHLPRWRAHVGARRCASLPRSRGALPPPRHDRAAERPAARVADPVLGVGITAGERPDSRRE